MLYMIVHVCACMLIFCFMILYFVRNDEIKFKQRQRKIAMDCVGWGNSSFLLKSSDLM